MVGKDRTKDETGPRLNGKKKTQAITEKPKNLKRPQEEKEA